MFGLIRLFLLFINGLLAGREVEKPQPISTKSCSSICSSFYGSVSCKFKDEVVSCGDEAPSGTVAQFKCNKYYVLEGISSATCSESGSWSSSLPKCKPDCGKQNSAVSLIVNGEISKRGTSPWHAGLYIGGENNTYEFWCGGSLVSENVVITAAHCVWKQSTEKIYLAFGKFKQDYNSEESDVQRVRAKSIKILDSYQDVPGNYNGDIAVIFLETPVQFNELTTPVCVDLEGKLVEQQVSEGNFGVVQGWGLTENDTFSDILRTVKIPVVSHKQCLSEYEADFKKFVTHTSFCAGYNNGSGVCNGDSGGGLSFYDSQSDRWYLQGLVSVSPRRKGTPYCDVNFRTIFTRVGSFNYWLNKIKEEDDENTRDLYSFKNCK